MAVTAPTLHEVAATGSDGNAGSDSNSGAFDPVTNVANMLTDLAATDANTSAPVVTSATYTFVAGDANSWLFISSGTNWLPGWYKIASVSGGAATLSAAAGAGVLWATGGPYSPSTAAGCATVASPTSGTGSVDYSQCGTAIVSAADLASANGTNATPTVTSASRTFTKNDVGNYLSITAGTNWTTGIFRITNTSAGGAVLDRACGSAASLSSGTYREGGCLASPGQAGANHVGGNHVYIKGGGSTYTVTSASTNVSAGCVSLSNSASQNQTAVFGYNAVRHDDPKTTSRPTIVADGVITTFVLLNYGSGCAASYLIIDGNSRTSSRGVASGTGGAGRSFYITGKNCTNSAFISHDCHYCDATGCATAAAFLANSDCYYCVAWSNTIAGFSAGTNQSSYTCCFSINNSGATTDGFIGSNTHMTCDRCVAYGNGRNGFSLTVGSSVSQMWSNCIAYGNTSGTGFNVSGAYNLLLLVNCAAGNNSTNVASSLSQDCQVGNITLTADPFTNAAGGDFSLNNTSGGGALLRAASVIGAFPGLASTLTYQDVGAVQHQDTASGGVVFVIGG